MTWDGTVAVYGGLIVGASLLGSAVPLVISRERVPLQTFLGLSAGILLGAVFFHILPDAFGDLGGPVGPSVVVGFLVLYLLERFLLVHVCDAGDCEVHTLGTTAVFGLSIHALTEGVALGAAAQSATLSLAVFVAIVAHKAPASFALVAILLAEGATRMKALIWAVVFAGLVPVGAFVYGVVAGGLPPAAQGAALGFSAGTFLHIALSDLLPELHKQSQQTAGIRPFLHLAGGLAIMYALRSLL